MPEPVTTDLAGGSLLDGYRLEEPLAGGSWATVYRATELASGRQAALKIARPAPLPAERPQRQAGAPDYPTRPFALHTGSTGPWSPDPAWIIEQEGDALEKIDHPGFVRLLGRGRTETGDPYLALAWIEGETLRRQLQRGTMLAPALLKPVVACLQDLQESGALACHGDVKPENILITPAGHAMLIDPASPATRRDDRGRVRALLTTPEYYPFLDQDDLPALGLLLWEMMTGVMPFGPRDLSGEFPCPLSPQLRRMMDWYATVGRGRYIRHLPYLPLPSGGQAEAPWLRVALPSLGVALAEDGTLERAGRYRSPAEFGRALAELAGHEE